MDHNSTSLGSVLYTAQQHLYNTDVAQFHEQPIHFPKLDNLEISELIEFMEVDANDNFPDTLLTEEIFYLTEPNTSTQEEQNKHTEITFAPTLTPETFPLKKAKQKVKQKKEIKQHLPETTRFSIDDPIFYSELRKAIQERESNIGCSQALLEECTQFVIEEYRKRNLKTITGGALGTIRRGKHKIGSVQHMLEQKAKRKQEEEMLNSEDPDKRGEMKEKEAQRKRMREFNKKIIIKSEEEIDAAAHKIAKRIITSGGPQYDTIFHIMKLFYEQKLPKEGTITRRQSDGFYSKLKKLLKENFAEEIFYKITSEILSRMKKGNMQWAPLFEKYAPTKK